MGVRQSAMDRAVPARRAARRGRGDDAGMNPRALLARTARMDAQEFRTRLVCAMRTSAGRARFAVARPRWKRERLLSVLDPSAGPLVADALTALRRSDWLASHRAFARPLQPGCPRWPLRAA